MLLISITILNFCLVSIVPAQVFKSQEMALRQAFPENATVRRKAVFLTDEQIKTIQEQAKTKVESKVVTYYTGTDGDSVLGFAYFESGIVRTKPATYMVVLHPEGEIKYVDILAFYEPLDYLPAPNWLSLFEDKQLTTGLWPGRDIHNITGATLTTRSITLGTRKVLAIHNIVTKQTGESN